MTELATSLVATDDDRLAQAEALVRGFCRWHIAPERTVTVTLDGTGGTWLYLPTLQLSGVTSITSDGTAVDLASVAWSTDGRVRRTDGSAWSCEPDGIVVTFTHGYTVTPVEVTAVVQAVAQRAVDNPGSRPRAQVGPFLDTFSQVGTNQSPTLALLDAEKATLRSYRIPAGF